MGYLQESIREMEDDGTASPEPGPQVRQTDTFINRTLTCGSQGEGGMEERVREGGWRMTEGGERVLVSSE